MDFTNFTWGDDLIDSRDIIREFEERQEEYDDLLETLTLAESELREHLDSISDDIDFDQESFDEEVERLEDIVGKAQDAFDEFDLIEFETLKSIVEQGEDSSDWGDETLIHEDYFETYIKDFINDCYEMPKEFDSGQWPWNHMEMNWSSAAEEAKVDYTTIEADGETYYIRST